MLIPLLLSPGSYATIYTVNASDQGWYGSIGNSTLVNYFAGYVNGFAHRDYFVFNLSGLPGGTISSATLSLYNPGIFNGDVSDGFSSPYPSETYQVGSVSTPISRLIEEAGSAAIFNDLAAGTPWGTQVVSSNDDGHFVQVPLNASFLSAANMQLGSGELAIGGFLVGDTGFTQNRYIFADTPNFYYAPQLILDIVPEPSIAAMGVLSATLLLRHAVRAKPRCGLAVKL